MIRLANRGGDADKAKFHPTAKNVKLYEYLLKTFANKGDFIFDSHLVVVRQGLQPISWDSISLAVRLMQNTFALLMNDSSVNVLESTQ